MDNPSSSREESLWKARSDGRHVWLTWRGYAVYESLESTPTLTVYSTSTAGPFRGRWLGESLTLHHAKRLAYQGAGMV